MAETKGIDIRNMQYGDVFIAGMLFGFGISLGWNIIPVVMTGVVIILKITAPIWEFLAG